MNDPINPARKRRWDRWKAECAAHRIFVRIHFSYTHPFFFVDGQPDKPLKRMERQIIVPHDGPVTDDALWEEHLYALIHPDGRTTSGTRLKYPDWLGDEIVPRKWHYCDRHGRRIEHRTARAIQVEQAKLRVESGFPA